MDIALRREVLLRADELRSEKFANQAIVTPDELDELNRIALLVLISGEGNLEAMAESELTEIFQNILGEDDLRLLDHVCASLAP